MFTIALTNVLVTLCYILPGFELCKWGKVSEKHLSTISTILVYLCSPCMIISALLQLPLTAKFAADMGLFFVITLALQLLFMLIIYLIFRKKYDNPQYRVLTVASVMGNVSFFGMPIIKALFPNDPELMAFSCVASLALNILVFTAGVFCVTGDKRNVNIFKGIFNPNTIGFAIGIALSAVNAGSFLPEALANAVRLLGDMSTPVCMIILGIRLASVSFSKLFTRPIVYAAVIMKLIVFPLFCYAAVYFLPLTQTFKASMLILSAAPCASMVLNVAEIYHGETELSANCVLLATLSCFITIPLLTLLL